MDTKHPHEIHSESSSRYKKFLVIGYLVLMANTGYLVTFYHATLFYYLNVALHVLLGLLLALPFVITGYDFLKNHARYGRGFGHLMGFVGYNSMIIAFLTGIFLVIFGKDSEHAGVFYTHTLLGVLGCYGMISSIRRAGYQISVNNVFSRAGRWGLVFFLAAALFPVLGMFIRFVFPTTNYVIKNYENLTSLLIRGAAVDSDRPFSPSHAQTSSGGPIKPDFLVDSNTCGQSGCHADIFSQWQESAHSEPAVKDDLYAEAFTWLQSTREDKNVTNLCAGCHTPALLFSGKGAEPVQAVAGTPEGDTGISCSTCHSTKRIIGTFGNGGYVVMRPDFYGLASSNKDRGRALYAAMLHLEPQPHKEFFLKPFMRDQTGAFCSTCHKLNPGMTREGVAIDMMNLYDSWQQGPYAGERVAAFKRINEKKDCASCHMPLIPSDDPAAIDGKVHDHTFRKMISESHTGEEENYLIPVTVQVMAYAPYSGRVPVSLHDINPDFIPVDEFDTTVRDTTWQVPEIVPQSVRIPSRMRAATIARGQDVRLDVLVSTDEIGHWFPGDISPRTKTWLELKIEDEQGRTVYHSGELDDFGRVDAGAWFWGSEIIDERGKILRRAHGLGGSEVAYRHKIPPGSADVITHVFSVPENSGDSLRVTATIFRCDLLTSKAAPESTNGKREHTEKKKIVVARNELNLKVVDSTASDVLEEVRKPGAEKDLRMYGVGLFRRGEYRLALHVYQLLAEKSPEDVRHWLGLLRINLALGDVPAAERALQRARTLQPENVLIDFWHAMLLKKQGKLEAAVEIFDDIEEHFSDDRIFLRQYALTLFDMGRIKKAVEQFRKVIAVAPDDVQTHYNLRECYKILGKDELLKEEENIYNRLQDRIPPKSAY